MVEDTLAGAAGDEDHPMRIGGTVNSGEKPSIQEIRAPFASPRESVVRQRDGTTTGLTLAGRPPRPDSARAGNGEPGLVQEAALDLFQAALGDGTLDWWEVGRVANSAPEQAVGGMTPDHRRAVLAARHLEREESGPL